MIYPINKNFESLPWTTQTTGTATVTYESDPNNGDSSGAIVVAETTVLGDEAYATLSITVEPLDVVVLRVKAFNDSGSTDRGLFRIESPLSDPSAGSVRANEDEMRSDDWTTYELRYQAPFKSGFQNYPLKIMFGFSDTRVGKAKFYDPQLEIIGNTDIHMKGSIIVTTDGVGGVTITQLGRPSTNFLISHAGNKWNAGTNEIQLEGQTRLASGQEGDPTVTQLRASGSEPAYVIRTRSFNSGSLGFELFDDTHAAVNLAAVAVTLRFSFKMGK